MRMSPIQSRGVVAGVLAAGSLALWFLAVDLIRSQPFDTPMFVAGALAGHTIDGPASAGLLALYTLLHFTVFILIGMGVALAFERSRIAPHPLLGLVLGFLLFDLLFYTGVIVTGVDVVRELGWPEVLIGNLIAGVVLVGYLHLKLPGTRYSLSEALEQHRIVKEGLVAGLVGAVVVMAWFLLIDAFRGQLFFTPAAIGSALFQGARSAAEVQVTSGVIIGYTSLHIAAFLGVGFVAAALAVAAESEPPLLLGLALLFVTTEALFIGLLSIVAAWLVDTLSWWAILAANLIAALVMGVYLWREHPRLREKIEEDVEEDLVHAGEV